MTLNVRVKTVFAPPALMLIFKGRLSQTGKAEMRACLGEARKRCKTLIFDESDQVEVHQLINGQWQPIHLPPTPQEGAPQPGR